jgi:hypothetical protein
VDPTSQAIQWMFTSYTDRVEAPGAQATSETHFPTHYSQLRAPLFNREWSIYPAVSPKTTSLPRVDSLKRSFASYLIANNVVYLTIAEKSYPRKLAFSYLDELQKEFDQSHGSQVDTVRKPYAFLSFGPLASPCASTVAYV